MAGSVISHEKFMGEMARGFPGIAEKLDVKDRKILYELSRNARFSYATIGKLVGLSREVVEYRVKRLIERKVLPGFMTLVDVARFGYMRTVLFLKFQYLDEKKEQRFIQWLLRHSNVIWIATCTGNWDMGLVVQSRDLDHFSNIFNDMKTIGGISIVDHLTLTETKNAPFPLKMFIDGLRYESKKIDRDSGSYNTDLQQQHHAVAPGAYRLKENERRVLQQLVSDARISLKDIALAANVDVSTASAIIKKLIREGVIYGFIPQVSFFKLGYQWHWIFLRFSSLDQKKEAVVLRFLREHPAIVWYVKHVGTWDMKISVFTRDSNHFRDVLNDLRRTFSGTLIAYDSVMIFDQYKYMHSIP